MASSDRTPRFPRPIRTQPPSEWAKFLAGDWPADAITRLLADITDVPGLRRFDSYA